MFFLFFSGEGIFSPLPWDANAECSCHWLEPPYVFCGLQFFDCYDECTTGTDVNVFRCALNSACSWSTGPNPGRCTCPSMCSLRQQLVHAQRELFQTLCTLNSSSWQATCDEKVIETHRTCGFWSIDGLSQYGESSISTTNVMLLQNLTTLTTSNQVSSPCTKEDAQYNGNGIYVFPDRCIVCGTHAVDTLAY